MYELSTRVDRKGRNVLRLANNRHLKFGYQIYDNVQAADTSQYQHATCISTSALCS